MLASAAGIMSDSSSALPRTRRLYLPMGRFRRLSPPWGDSGVESPWGDLRRGVLGGAEVLSDVMLQQAWGWRSDIVCQHC